MGGRRVGRASALKVLTGEYERGLLAAMLLLPHALALALGVGALASEVCGQLLEVLGEGEGAGRCAARAEALREQFELLARKLEEGPAPGELDELRRMLEGGGRGAGGGRARAS